MKTRSKFGNRKAKDELGNVFDSAGELGRWRWLQLMERRGIIRDLKRQVSYELLPAVTSFRPKQLKTKVRYEERQLFPAYKYVADFVYERNGQTIVEDYKGFRTAIFKLKKAMLYNRYGIEVFESHNMIEGFEAVCM